MDKNKSFVFPKSVRPTSSSRTAVNVSTISNSIREPEDSNSDFDLTKISYKNFLRNVLTECLVEEKIKTEETQMDIQMAQLAERFQRTMDQLDKTSKRLKDVNFVVEQKRLLDMKNQECFYDATENIGLEEKINNVVTAEEARLHNLETHNVDFGYNNETGHKQLLDAVNDAIDGLESIRKNCNLDANMSHEFKESNTKLEISEKDRLDIDGLKREFDNKFPKFCEKLLIDLSDSITLFMENYDD